MCVHSSSRRTRLGQGSGQQLLDPALTCLAKNGRGGQGGLGVVGGRQRGGGKGKAQDVAFVRCISNNYNPLGLIMCHALCFYLIRIPPRDFGILAPFHGWGAGAQKG